MINTNDYNLKNIAIAILSIAVIALSVYRCEPTEKIITIKTPKVEGKFASKKPIQNKVLSTINKTEPTSTQHNAENEFLQQEINKLLSEQDQQEKEFLNANDSLKNLLFIKAIELKEFKSQFEDENIKIDIAGYVAGEIKSVAPTYTIKPKNVSVVVRQKERIFALKTGLEYGNNISLNKGLFKINLEFENKKGNSFNISYDTENRYWLGYKLTLFEIKN